MKEINKYQCPYEENTKCLKIDEPCGLCDVFIESKGFQYLEGRYEEQLKNIENKNSKLYDFCTQRELSNSEWKELSKIM